MVPDFQTLAHASLASEESRNRTGEEFAIDQLAGSKLSHVTAESGFDSAI